MDFHNLIVNWIGLALAFTNSKSNSSETFRTEARTEKLIHLHTCKLGKDGLATFISQGRPVNIVYYQIQILCCYVPHGF